MSQALTLQDESRIANVDPIARNRVCQTGCAVFASYLEVFRCWPRGKMGRMRSERIGSRAALASQFSAVTAIMAIV